MNHCNESQACSPHLPCVPCTFRINCLPSGPWNLAIPLAKQGPEHGEEDATTTANRPEPVQLAIVSRCFPWNHKPPFQVPIPIRERVHPVPIYGNTPRTMPAARLSLCGSPPSSPSPYSECQHTIGIQRPSSDYWMDAHSICCQYIWIGFPSSAGNRFWSGEFWCEMCGLRVLDWVIK